MMVTYMKNKFEPFFQPTKIGKLQLKNKLCMAPMFTKYASESGEVTDKLISYLKERARGGVGLIVLENTCIDWEYGRVDGNPVTIHHDRFRPGLNDLVSRVHRAGAKIVTEIHHVGRQTFSSNIEGRAPLAPSAISSKVGGSMPQAMNDEEIEKAIQDFADAARRTRECGFDGVELHGAHGYLLSNFISPQANKRNDKWGGSFENRCRFAVEVVRRVRREVGPDYPLLFRFSAEEPVPGGLSLQEGLEYARILEQEGVDALDVSCGSYETIKHFPMQGNPADQLVYLAEAVKKAVGIPVIAVGSLFFDPSVALDVIASGKADLLHIGRGLLADPFIPYKLSTGKAEYIRSCIRCNECTGSLDKGHYLKCAVNPLCGYEYLESNKQVSKVKKVIVVGGGPAGMEYALVSAMRGHKVVLMEKEKELGGLARVASKPAYKKPEILGLLEYYRLMLSKCGVKTMLDTEGTFDSIEKLNPDKVVLATGSQPVQLPLRGGEKAHSAVDKLLQGSLDLGNRVCIIGGSGVGLDTAMYIAESGRDVTVLEMEKDVGRELSHLLKTNLLNLLDEKNVNILTGHTVKEIDENGLIVESENGELNLACDDVIYATGFVRTDVSKLYQQLCELGLEVTMLGPAQGSGHFMDAIHGGYWTGMSG